MSEIWCWLDLQIKMKLISKGFSEKIRKDIN